jgi:hypothetical protein
MSCSAGAVFIDEGDERDELIDVVHSFQFRHW